MADSKMIAASVMGFLGCISCLVFVWYVMHGGLSKEALIAMILCCVYCFISSMIGISKYQEKADGK